MCWDRLYFDWLCNIVMPNFVVNSYHNNDYTSLLFTLHGVSYTPTLELDNNRITDGLMFREKYIQGNYTVFDSYESLEIFRNKECSLLEMMVALCYKIANTILDNLNEMPFIFKDIINSLGLSEMTEPYFDENYIINVLDNFCNNNYYPNGKGGLFELMYSNVDMRTLDIWAQANRYILEHYNL